jgi:hypothetical protein
MSSSKKIIILLLAALMLLSLPACSFRKKTESEPPTNVEQAASDAGLAKVEELVENLELAEED